jgi:hypothetical protein
MAFPASLEDTSGTPIPIGQAYLDGQNAYAANQSSPFTHTDSNSNTSAAPQVLPAPSTLGLPVITPSIRQKANGSTGSGAKTLAVAFPNNIADGNSIVVVMGMGEVEAAGITLAITDSQSLSYTQAVKGSNSTTQEAAIFYATNTQLGANTVTATIAGGSSSNTAISMEIYEVEGLITVASLIVDQTASNNAASGTAVTTANITPNYANEIAFMAVAAAGGTIAAGTGWTLDTGGALSPSGGNLVSFGAQSRFQMTQGPLVPAATLGTSNAWAACTAVFRSMHVQQEGTHIIQGGFSEFFGSAGAANADIINMDVSGYKWLTLHINTNAYSGTLSLQGSNDNVNWISVNFENASSASLASSIISTTNIMITGPIYFRYFRAHMASYTSGAAQGVLELFTIPPPAFLTAISGSPSVAQSGTWTVGLSNGDNTILISGARTTTQTSSDKTNTAARGIRVVLDVTVAGTGSVTLEIDAKDATSGKYTPLLTGAAVTTNSTNVYVVYPNLTPVANSIASDVLPTTWRVVITANNANSVTYSVGSSYLL